MRVYQVLATVGSKFSFLPFILVDAHQQGTKLTPPSTLPGSEKLEGVAWLHEHVEKIKKSKNICVIGGGAVGVQMSTDIKEIYPDKRVVLVHSRQNVMNRFHPKLHGIIAERAKELDIELVLGSRVKLPEGGFPTDGSTFDVQLVDGRKLENFDFAIICTGQTPHSEIMKTLSAEVVDQSGFIRTKPTLQIADDKLPHVFAVGDVAASGAPKAARPYVPCSNLYRAALTTEQGPRASRARRKEHCCAPQWLSSGRLQIRPGRHSPDFGRGQSACLANALA